MTMPELLERAGFRLRGTKRADCAHCPGHSRGTVSFTGEVAYCHRCHWTANAVTLARQVGVPTGRAFPGTDAGLKPGPTNGTSNRPRPVGPPFRAASQPADLARLRREALLREFELWRQQQIQRLYDEDRARTRAIMRCNDWMQRIPECEEQGWEALKRYYDDVARLNCAIDFLTCAVDSRWLERDSTIVDVFRAWRRWLRRQREPQ
ncbi:MAG: hypothetical protein M1453_07100 [Acidobacteria bacterium]|nr:hypothetical protein [Acidobacteriota bacterium]